MTKTCAEKIEEIQGIDVYRAIVNAAIPGSSAPILGASTTSVTLQYFFPDPQEYAAQIEGAPTKIAGEAKILGPNGREDVGSMAGRYRDIKTRLEAYQKDLDQDWHGDAADAFVTDYLPALFKHMDNLVDACEAQKLAAQAVEERITQAHNQLKKAVSDMVTAVLWWVTGGAATNAGAGVVGALGSAAALTVAAPAAAAASVVVMGGIIQELIVHHEKLQEVLDDLDAALGGELCKQVGNVMGYDLETNLDSYASTTGWQR